MTRANCVAGVLIKVASFVAGALSRPSNLARKTSRLGKSASAMMSGFFKPLVVQVSQT